jgi:hypothetical protein
VSHPSDRNAPTRHSHCRSSLTTRAGQGRRLAAYTEMQRSRLPKQRNACRACVFPRMLQVLGAAAAGASFPEGPTRELSFWLCVLAVAVWRSARRVGTTLRLNGDAYQVVECAAIFAAVARHGRRPLAPALIRSRRP